jgi:glucose/arabinose dehydrogenase
VQAPTFTSPATVSVSENFTDVVYRPVAVDAQNDPLTYGAIGGPDAARFTTNPVTREIRFASPPDYERPSDVGGNNVYNISFTVSDGTNITTQNVAITVTDVKSGYNVRRIPWDSLTSILAGYPGGSGRIVMLRHTGTLALVDPATGSFTSMAEFRSTPYFDSSGISDITIYDLAFSPNFVADRTFYIALYRQGQGIEIVKFRMSATAVDQVDLASADVIFRAPIAGTEVDGIGFMKFDSAGLLYIGIGSSAFDVLADSAQDPNSTYGKIMRIDPSSDAFPTDPDRDYAIPASNPFASGGGLPEVYAMGVVHPRYAHFDPETHSIVFSDQGSFTSTSGGTSIAFQELNRLDTTTTQVQNFGWPLMTGNVPKIVGMSYPGLARPVAQYDAFVGNDIRGGIAYRGPIEDFQGYYFFGDASQQKFWRVMSSQIAFGALATIGTFDNVSSMLPVGGPIPPVGPYMIGTDTRGNLYFGATVTSGTGFSTSALYIVEPAP